MSDVCDARQGKQRPQPRWPQSVARFPSLPLLSLSLTCSFVCSHFLRPRSSFARSSLTSSASRPPPPPRPPSVLPPPGETPKSPFRVAQSASYARCCAVASLRHFSSALRDVASSSTRAATFCRSASFVASASARSSCICSTMLRRDAASLRASPSDAENSRSSVVTRRSSSRSDCAEARSAASAAVAEYAR